MSEVIVRALREEARRADIRLRQAFARVAQLTEFNGGANQVAYDYPRGQVAKALEIIHAATRDWDDVNAALKRAIEAQNAYEVQ